MSIALCTIVAHNIAQNRPDDFPLTLQTIAYHCSDDVYLRERGMGRKHHVLQGGTDLPWEGAILVDRGADCKV